MKKLVMIAAVAVVSFAANAGSANWSSDAVQYADSTDWATGIAYLFVGNSTDGVADAILAGTWSSAGSLATTTMEGEDGLYKSKVASYTSTSASMYMVLFDAANVADAEHFIVSDVVSKTFGASGNQTFDFSASVIKANWQAVPEPTSGLLLLLGVAGLALKRKRA